MNRLFPLLATLLVGLTACVPAGQAPKPQPLTPASTAATELPPARHYTGAEIAKLRERLHHLPGAQVLPGEPLRLRYHGNLLFAPDAVLPLPGGERLLAPLAGLLAESGWSWEGVVRAETGHGKEYDAELAAGRLQMLQRYLAHKGVGSGLVDWQTRAEPGPSLELTLRMTQ